MNDRYLFKAKQKNWKELPKEQWWVQGFLFQHMTEGGFEWCIGTEPLTANDYSEICGEGKDWFYIDESTLSRYTSLEDRNGNLIWENDIVKFDVYKYEKLKFSVVSDIKWSDDLCSLSVVVNKQGNRGTLGHFLDWNNKVEVIGNIFDNPKLLEGEQEQEDEQERD